MTTKMTDCWIRGLLRCTGGVHSLGHNVQSVADMNRITRADTITYSTWQTMVSILHHTFLSERSVTLQLPEPAPGVLPELCFMSRVSQVPAGYSWAIRPGTLQVVCEASGPAWCNVGPPFGWGGTRWGYTGSSGYSGVWQCVSACGSWTLPSLCLHPPVYLGMVYHK